MASLSRWSTSSTATPAKCPSAWDLRVALACGGGTPLVKAIDKIVANAKKIAAHLLEAAEADIEFADGKFSVAGTDRCVPFAQVTFAAYAPHNYPIDTLEPSLNETAFYDPINFTA